MRRAAAVLVVAVVGCAGGARGGDSGGQGPTQAELDQVCARHVASINDFNAQHSGCRYQDGGAYRDAARYPDELQIPCDIRPGDCSAADLAAIDDSTECFKVTPLCAVEDGGAAREAHRKDCESKLEPVSEGCREALSSLVDRETPPQWACDRLTAVVSDVLTKAAPCQGVDAFSLDATVNCDLATMHCGPSDMWVIFNAEQTCAAEVPAACSPDSVGTVDDFYFGNAGGVDACLRALDPSHAICAGGLTQSVSGHRPDTP